jgi:serine protease
MKYLNFQRQVRTMLLPVTVLMAFSVAALAQSAPQKVSLTAAQRVAFAGPLATDRTFSRLIVKFREEASTRAGVFDFNAARDQVSLLSADSGKKTGAGKSMRLAYLKSISPDIHVALASENLSRAELFALAKQLEQDPRVAYAEIDEMAQALLVPSDPDYASRQWHYKGKTDAVGGANLPTAWDTTTGTGVVVAVLDTGYRAHADLAANVLSGYDFISDIPTANDGDGRDGDAQDPGDWNPTASGSCAVSNSSWHGTHVAGTVAALNNTLGGVGVAFGAKVLPVRVLGVCGGFVSDIAAGMRWAAGLAVPGVTTNANPAKILNLSLGSSGTCSSTYQDAITAVRAAGSAVLAATGNDGVASINQPANCTGVIAVTAHTKGGDNANYANIGSGTTLSAPGGGFGTLVLGSGDTVYSTYNSGTTVPVADSYAGLRGTSLAVPHVAGVAALLVKLKPAITPDELQSVLVNSTRPHPLGTFCASRSDCGSGLLDAAKAVTRLTSLDPNTSATVSPSGIRPTGSTISLVGTASAVTGGSSSFSYQWTQLAGPSVSLSGATSSTASFVAPATGASFVFVLRATDASTLFSESQVGLSTNTAPVLNSIAPQSVALGGNLSFTATATDAESNTVAFVANGLPAGSSFGAASGVFTWNNASPAGNYSFTITPNDGSFNGTAQTVTIAVVAPSGGGGGGAVGWPELLALLALASAGWLSGWRPKRARR